jgi:acyl carrier protein
MNKLEILKSLQLLMEEFFKLTDLTISENTTAKDIDAWDSLNHMNFIREVEGQFNIQFDFFEVMEFENIGELVKTIKNKI